MDRKFTRILLRVEFVTVLKQWIFSVREIGSGLLVHLLRVAEKTFLFFPFKDERNRCIFV